jgi:gamma-glutamyltranspeptidase / glutathione hydrolase
MSVLGVVAAGHPSTAEAAAGVLRAGGNAFDAAVAAGFAASVAEPCLTSPGGGGFLMARTAVGQETLFDFFVAVPGLGAAVPHDPARLEAVTVSFEAADQVFHVGPASVATPGCLAGFLRVHERLGRLPLDRVVAPAVDLARGGVVVNLFVADVVALLAGTLARTEVGRSLFFVDDHPIAEGDLFRNVALGEFLRDVGDGRITHFDPAGLGAGITAEDVRAYEVIEREPLRVGFREATVMTNPLPSLGGTLIAAALEDLARTEPLDGEDDLARIVDALIAQYERRARLGPGHSSGTTHVSVEDADGNVAAMTTSNGSCSGEFATGTGVQLNNMMGEEDLHPAGFGSLAAGTRISSMMSPTLVDRGPAGLTALGSGGSERIRSVIVQVIVNLVERGMSLRDAVEAPRMHWDGGALQYEPGPDPALMRHEWQPNPWKRRDLYFGGVHAVSGGRDAVGDPRRGGSALVVEG